MKWRSLITNKLFFSGGIALGILFVVLFFSSTYPVSSVLKYANLGIRNILFSMDTSWQERKIHPSLTLVAIDDRTLTDKDRGGLGRWQDFDRAYYAQVIKNLNDAGALAIGVDVLFSEKWASDDILAKALVEAKNVTLWLSLSKNKAGEDILPPTKTLAQTAHSIGYFQPNIDPTNDLVYGISPAIRTDSGEVYEPFSLATLRTYLDAIKGVDTTISPNPFAYEGFASFHEKGAPFLPLSRIDKNEVLINYVPRALSYPVISFSDVYQGNFDPSRVKDKMIFIGATATALHDEFFTPIGITPGVLIHMNLINTILTGDYLTYVAPYTEIAVIVLLTFLLTLFLMHVENRTYQLFYSFTALTLWGFFYLVVFTLSSKIFIHPVEIIMIVILVAISVTAYKYIYEEKGKRLLKNTLSQYLAEDLVTSVLSNYEEVKLWGTRKEVTLFFSDIAGFTTLSENMEPEELVRFLSIYLKEVSDIIIHERGFVNKYEGDAVMAIWGAFGLEDRQSYLACKSALLQQEAITKINAEFERTFGFSIQVRMGLNKWPAVVGNIGSAGKKIEYTAIGDSVNTASRLEGINKLYGTLICVGQNIYESEKDTFVFRKLDSIMVKGKDRSLWIYELVGYREQVEEMTLTKIARFEQGLALYQSQSFIEAQKIFESLITEYQDPPSVAFIERTKEYIKNGCPPDWNGEYRALEK